MLFLLVFLVISDLRYEVLFVTHLIEERSCSANLANITACKRKPYIWIFFSLFNTWSLVILEPVQRWKWNCYLRLFFYFFFFCVYCSVKNCFLKLWNIFIHIFILNTFCFISYFLVFLHSLTLSGIKCARSWCLKKDKLHYYYIIQQRTIV